MAFCKNCGTQLDDQAKFCPECGVSAGEPEKTVDFTEKLVALNDTHDTTAEFDKEDIEKNKGMAILAYLSWLVLIPLFAASNSKFAHYHCNQGIVLWLAGVVASIFGFIPVVRWIVPPILGVVTFILSVLGIINAATGKAKELPLIGKYRILK